MLGNLSIYEIKPLKGPDRLLRLHVVIDVALQINDSIEMLGEITRSLVSKYHRLNIDFPVSALIASLPANIDYHNFKYGELLNGKLGIEILFMRKSDSTFKIRYYPPELEFERNLSSANHFMSRNEIDIDSYNFRYTHGNLREGFNVQPLNIKIPYTRQTD